MNMITLSKIAKLAHVSVSTASKAFSMSAEVNEQTREQVFEIAKQYGCFKKYFNAKYPKYVVAIICPEFKSRYYSHILSYLQRNLEDHNCEICVASTNFSAETEKELLEYYSNYTAVDGVIVVDGRLETDKAIEIPVIAVNSETSNNTIISFSSDFKSSMEEAINYFLDKNAKTIGFIGEKYTSIKLEVYKDIIKRVTGEIPEKYISISDNRFEEGGYEAMEKLISSGNIPRALICAYDNLAIGAMRCVFDKGLRVPDDVAILGIDNIRESKYSNPPLSSISTHAKDICEAASNAVIGMLSNKPFEANKTFKSELILRESTKI